jgi:hypothetical protein
VLDSSKIQAYMSCPRAYFFRYILGWSRIEPNIHLEFGTAWHKCMEVLLEKGYTGAACAEAFEVFYEHYRLSFGPDMDDANKPKIPANVLRGLPQYCAQYSSDLDNFEVLHIEVAGSVSIGGDRLIHFKTDTICKGPQGYFSLEHKTGSSFSTSWTAQWRQKMQTGTYQHVLCSMFDPDEVWGVLINGAFFRNAPKIKKDGTPYANATDNEFHRIPSRRSLLQMEGWLDEVNFWVDKIEQDHKDLQSVTKDDPIMNAFQKNTESCSSYGQCPYLDYCSVWSNPLQHIEEVPSNYKVEHWDPRKQPTARELVKL